MIQHLFKNPNSLTSDSLNKFRRVITSWTVPRAVNDQWYFQLHYSDGQVTTVYKIDDAIREFERRHTNRILFCLKSVGGSVIELDTRDRTRVSCNVKWSQGKDYDLLTKVAEAFGFKSMPRTVFITHGRSEDWRHVRDFIESDAALDLRAIILEEQPHGGSPYIGEKFERYAEQSSCAIVLMSGDDKAYDPSDKTEIRARENVLHEIGYFQATLGRDRVILLKEDDVNIPSNIVGRGYISYEKGRIKETDTKLRNELIEIFK